MRSASNARVSHQPSPGERNKERENQRCKCYTTARRGFRGHCQVYLLGHGWREIDWAKVQGVKQRERTFLIPFPPIHASHSFSHGSSCFGACNSSSSPSSPPLCACALAAGVLGGLLLPFFMDPGMTNAIVFQLRRQANNRYKFWKRVFLLPR